MYTFFLRRERISAGHPCDQRGALGPLRRRFPGVDFSHVRSETAQPLAELTHDEREPVHLVQARGLELLRCGV